MEIKVYNAEQIGGCFTVITTSKSKIMIDYGLALPGAKVEQEDFDWEHDTVDAVFITHYHGDHVGKIVDIPAPIPIYMGRATKAIMLNIHKALIRVPKFKEEQKKWMDLLKGNRIHEVEENKPITEINGIRITPYSVDHSAYDAYMYLIEADEKVILHTGDFRGHGYRGSIMLDAIKDYVHENGRMVDYLITEGTMLGDRKNEEVKGEENLQEEATKLFAECKYAFLVISSTNLDSLYSFYKAARAHDMRMYCYNYYFYNQLKTFSRYAEENGDEYQFDLIYTANFDASLGEDIWGKPKTQEELMRKHGFLCVIKADDKYHPWIERFKDKNPLVIYSMWDGYINRDKGKDAYSEEWAKFFEPYIESGQYRDLHTSGHATAKMIAEVIRAVDPQEEIIPMHTENVNGFRELDIDDKYKKMIGGRHKRMVSNKNMKKMLEIINKLTKMIPEEHQANIFWSPKTNTEDGKAAGFRLYAYGGYVLRIFEEDGELKFETNFAEYKENYFKKSWDAEFEKMLSKLCKQDADTLVEVIPYMGIILDAYKKWIKIERRRENTIARNLELYPGKNNFYIIDMESSIKTSGKKPDLIGIRNENGKTIVSFIEYKCTKSGIDGVTLAEHFEDMVEYYGNVDMDAEYRTLYEQMHDFAEFKYQQLGNATKLEKIDSGEMVFLFSNVGEGEFTAQKVYNNIRFLIKIMERYPQCNKDVKFLILKDENELYSTDNYMSADEVLKHEIFSKCNKEQWKRMVEKKK